MSINEVIKFIYSNTTDDYIIVDCQILEELVENLKNNTKPIYSLDEIKGVIADIKASLPIDKEMEDTLEEFVAEIDSKFFNGDKIEEKKIKKVESLKESAKPINEKNVAKFVDELNEWCDDNIHFADLESAKYTREYGKLYDFEWGWDYSYGDKGLIKVWDNEGTLDWFEETRVKDFIVKLAKKYGWYAEPVTNDSDFTFDEL